MGNSLKNISKNYQSINNINQSVCLTSTNQVYQPNHNNIPDQFICKTAIFNSGQYAPSQIYKNINPYQLTILTYNIWFEQQNNNNRIPNIIKILYESDADFICLQQVTGHFLECLRHSKLLQKYYVGQYAMHWYDTVILSKYKCVNYKIPFSKSFMGRSLYIAQLRIENESILVASAHLQSLDNTEIRIAQLLQTFNYLKWGNKSVFVGDFNFTDGWQENKAIPKQYNDLFLCNKKQGQLGSTMLKTPKYSEWRPDHVLAKGFNIQKSKFHIIGKFSVPPYESQSINKINEDGLVRTPSDHLGIYSSLYIH